ncbi:hypothetical protein [Bacillus sp. V2I10]|uniref:hypothetical protein n=1 Tax=Bacillus sp. V2I10 TaxID=3042276 RepID=UPI0027863B07|nr:hypothetical protein [Bacillus sp. V2I10]MDQ0858032.1 cell division ATPase FtsA [Bacillus sp. V2I10]
MRKETYTFALDIGTRSVVGLLLSEKGGTYEVIDTVIQEHGERSMLDGQIHDVIAVSNVIASVKEELEKKHGPLREVCVAAAGRALKTVRAGRSSDRNRGQTHYSDRNGFSPRADGRSRSSETACPKRKSHAGV